MKVTRSIAAATRFCDAAARPLVLVPTMGALHRGHAALVRRARQIAGRRGSVAVSIFVNPAQFGPKEDFAAYPRTFGADRQLCADLGADLLFHPRADALYPDGYSTYVQEESVSLPLCGRSRPGHFKGVCTVVLKLFQITRPDAAVFGLKDLQQYMVICRMVHDFNVPVRIIPVGTVREPDGLALSSRNRHLSNEERVQAPVLWRALKAAEAAFRGGETNASKLRRLIVRRIAAAPLARIDYVEVVEAHSLRAVETVTKESVFALAVFFGKTRLIDNLWIHG
jgi:pantoate--beta-alanine ligase